MAEIIIKLLTTNKKGDKLQEFDANSDVITKDSIGKIVLPFSKENPTHEFVNKCRCNISLNLINLNENAPDNLFEPFYTKMGAIPELYIQG